MVRVDLQGFLEGRLGTVQVARLEACQAALEVGFWVLAGQPQNFSSPRWRTGSGKSR